MSSDVCIEDDIMTSVSCFVVNSGGLSILTPLYMVGSVNIINEFKKNAWIKHIKGFLKRNQKGSSQTYILDIVNKYR